MGDAKEYRQLPDLSLDLTDGNDDVYRLLQEIKPKWEKQRIQVESLCGGASCHMLRCSEESGQSVTVRVRKNFEGLRDPEHERQIIKVMSAKGIFPPLLAIFQNGFAYEYIQGRPFLTKNSTELNVDDEQLRLIAEGMAVIHPIVVPEFDYTKSGLFDFVIQVIADVKPCFEGCPTKDELVQELRIVEELVSTVESPLVHLHGDPHLANMVWNHKQKKVTYVDWEISLPGQRAYDIAYFFNSIDNVDFFLNIPMSMPIDKERKFCVYYLKRWNELCNKPTPTVDEIEQLLLELKYFMLVVNAVRMVFMVKFAAIVSASGGMERVWKYSFDRYTSIKDELFGIKTLGRPSADSKLSP